jgi:membrane protein implicated in regulation of membrane protease activity
MEGFWQIISLVISLLGFAVVGVLSLWHGTGALEAVLRAVAAFLVLWKIQSLMHALLLFAAEDKSAADKRAGRTSGRTGEV